MFNVVRISYIILKQNIQISLLIIKNVRLYDYDYSYNINNIK